MEIAYDGARYKGWQRLGNNPNTVQEKIETVLSKFADKKVEIHGSGRTDAGVHALNQCASFELKKESDPFEIKEYLNRYLPDDIAVNLVVSTDERFHARYNAVSKIYQYRIRMSDVVDPFQRKYSLFIDRELNVNLMEKGATFFIGEHDFTAYTTAKSKKKSFVREIKRIDIYMEGEELIIDVEGTGFLHNMVRMMVGSLIEVGLKNMKPIQIKENLKSGDRSQTGPTAPPHGLFLKEVRYE